MQNSGEQSAAESLDTGKLHADFVGKGISQPEAVPCLADCHTWQDDAASHWAEGSWAADRKDGARAAMERDRRHRV